MRDMFCRVPEKVRFALSAMLAALLALAPPVAFGRGDFPALHTVAAADDLHDDEIRHDPHRHCHAHERSAPDHSHEAGATFTAQYALPSLLPSNWVIATQHHVNGRTSHPPERPPRLIART